jgi:hypothetical protein
VARDGFEALMAGKSQVVAGSAKNKVQAAAAKLLPDQPVASPDTGRHPAGVPARRGINRAARRPSERTG